MKKIKVIISNDNKHAVTDWNARDWYLSLSDGDTAFVATGIMFNELRLGVRLNEVEPFEFEFEGQVITCSDKGQLSEWPIRFMDQQGIQIKALMKNISYDQSRNELNLMRFK